jgi:hypothetical protein
MMTVFSNLKLLVSTMAYENYLFLLFVTLSLCRVGLSSSRLYKRWSRIRALHLLETGILYNLRRHTKQEYKDNRFMKLTTGIIQVGTYTLHLVKRREHIFWGKVFPKNWTYQSNSCFVRIGCIIILGTYQAGFLCLNNCIVCRK